MCRRAGAADNMKRNVIGKRTDGDRRNVVVVSPSGGSALGAGAPSDYTMAVLLEQPGEDVPRVRRQPKKTLQACPGVLCARGAQVAHPRAARGKVISSACSARVGRRRPGSEALSLGHARWTTNRKRYARRARGPHWFGTRRRAWTSPLLDDHRRSPSRVASSRGWAGTWGRPSWSARRLPGVCWRIGHWAPPRIETMMKR